MSQTVNLSSQESTDFDMFHPRGLPTLGSQALTAPMPRAIHPSIATRTKAGDIHDKMCSRAGVLIYVVEDGVVFYGFGLDSEYKELTDFAGKMVVGLDKSCVHAALREFNEESLGIFGQISPLAVRLAQAIWDGENFIILYYSSLTRQSINFLFHAQLEKRKQTEVCDIVWLTHEELRAALCGEYTYRIYSVVREFLIASGALSCPLVESGDCGETK